VSHYVKRLIIEIGSHTAGIVTRDERSFRFFSSEPGRQVNGIAGPGGVDWSLACRRGLSN
jgi:hypothetical protein